MSSKLRVRSSDDDDGRAVEYLIVGRAAVGSAARLAVAVSNRGGEVRVKPKMPPGCYYWSRDGRDDPYVAHM